jgi:protein-disulfide isomerase
MRRLLPIFALLATACAATPRHDDLDARLAAIEAALASQRTLLEGLAHGADRGELTAIAAQLATLQEQLKQLDEHRRPLPAPRRPEPDPAVVYAVPIDGDPAFGPADAKVTLVMAMDFACPYCKKAFATVDDLRARYGKDLRVVYQDYVVHPRAKPGATAACAAHLQGAWRPMADALWAKAFPDQFADGLLDGLAADLGLDVRRFRRDADGPCVARVEATQARLAKLGVGATPSFFINGRFMSGAQPIDNFARLIDEERTKATAAINHGLKPDRYYQSLVDHGQSQLVAPAAP